ncbi:hypothetical protein [Pelomicrobium sp.]|uniref:hypothetical protein n=1 Tax=Pelomicrobium sp. TaxID=2815319 RepID=UPI002FDDB91A
MDGPVLALGETVVCARFAPGATSHPCHLIYIALFRLALPLTGRRFARYVEGYRSNRGMNYYHDVHDWMGVWPYESIQPAEVDFQLGSLGFAAERVFARKGRLFGRDPGIFGSRCDEYIYRKIS